jgi:carbohydrate-selective porin OprB
VNIFVYPCEGAYVGAGLYDGAATVDGQRTGALGPGDFLGDDQSDDWFIIGEAGYAFASAGAVDSTRVAVGGWWHTGEFATFAGGTEDGTGGLYALAESRVWRPEAIAADDDARGLWFFLQYGCADESVSAVRQQFGAGVSLAGTFAGRDLDSLGAYLSVVDFTDEPAAALGDSEWSLELFYEFACTPSVRIKPDLQWFAQPAGGGDDALVGTLRVTIAF